LFRHRAMGGETSPLALQGNVNVGKNKGMKR